jgi:hypothetical protein
MVRPYGLVHGATMFLTQAEAEFPEVRSPMVACRMQNL